MFVLSMTGCQTSGFDSGFASNKTPFVIVGELLMSTNPFLNVIPSTGGLVSFSE